MDRKSDANLAQQFRDIREQTVQLCATLAPEDTVIQSMPDTSPTKWHLAHITWFFERFVLEEFVDNYRRFDDDYDFMFNSYYYSVGKMHARPQRGLLSRPTWSEVIDYRRHVDFAMQSLLEQRDDNDVLDRVVLGLNHEQQHQELLLTDIKHVLSCNPLQPTMNRDLLLPQQVDVGEYTYHGGQTGIRKVGATGLGFRFDNELPRHDTLLQSHQIGDRLITNGEFLGFIEDGGYQDSNLWLSDGWAIVNERGWQRPLYWDETCESEFTLAGVRALDKSAPVSHVSYYEADAYARWAGARLPTEFEWEDAAADLPVTGNLMEDNYWQPVGAIDAGQFFGDVWEWTSSAYLAYPGFKPLPGALGEYNGKFMSNQMTVRGGSCATASSHIRASYRSFFYPDARWQFLGFRLAKDGAA